MRTYLSYHMELAQRSFDRIAAGAHPHVTHLVEVFERDGLDRERLFGPDTYGELWAFDETGLDEADAAQWRYCILDTVGFDESELQEMGVQS